MSFDTQFGRPGAQIVRARFTEQIAPAIRFVDIASGEVLHWFAVREIESSAAGEKKFPADGALSIAHYDACSSGAGNFRGAQSGRAATDDEDWDGVRGHRRM
jgi:hypothetical protein